ncbi:MAG: T9SS type A sorting domain-containing protein [FCB group bacterium]|nr:T9SS type A sorting domain-containing protein [FCB group bacterium]
MKVKFLLVLSALVVFSFSLSFGAGYTIDHVDGAYGTQDSIQTGVPVVFYIRTTNDSNYIFGVGTNGFRIYSPDSATWGGTVPDTVYPGWSAFWAFGFYLNAYSVDGAGADTVGFGGIGGLSTGPGLPAGFDSVTYSITIGPIDTTNHGKTICIDSSYYPPAGEWLWGADPPNNGISPNWYATPQCYTIINPNELAVTEIGGGNLPAEFSLQQNYPNPFNPTTQINFDLPTKSKVSILIYNVLGQKIKTLVDEQLEAGKYVEEWDGTNDAGVKVSSGIYFYKMQADNFVQTKKMMLLK